MKFDCFTVVKTCIFVENYDTFIFRAGCCFKTLVTTHANFHTASPAKRFQYDHQLNGNPKSYT
jgi:hypothetical protein